MPEEENMIVVRNVFRLKFGQSREAVSAWKEMAALSQRVNWGARELRLLTDAVGPFYTLVFEATFDDLATYEREAKRVMGIPEWGEVYRRFAPHVESGYREVFSVVALE
jgi:hypothetical protein